MSETRRFTPIGRRRLLRGIAGGVVGLAAAACRAPGPRIDFARLESPTPEPSSASPGVEQIRVAVAPIYSPQRTSQVYQELGAYASRVLGRPVEFIQSKNYLETNDLVRSGHAPFAMVCTFSYVLGQEDFGMELAAAPVIGGTLTYYSLLVVPADASTGSLEDLRGSRFAFTDPMSNSGRLAPTYELVARGLNPQSFFSQTIFTYAHDRSIVAVADGVVDGAAVDSVVFEQLAKREPQLAARVRVIERWGPFGSSPIVCDPRFAAEWKGRTRQMFLAMHERAEGRRLLEELGVDRYVVPQDSAYDSVRKMRNYLREHGLSPQ